MQHIAIGIFLFTANAALAEEEVKGLVLPAVSLASEHRFNGMSLTNRNPALQLSVHYWRADGYYAGIWTTNVDFLDSNNTSIELDSYVGRNFNLGNDVELKLEGMYTAFNDDEPGPTYDFFQAKVGISRILGNWTPAASIKWSPSGPVGTGQTWHFDGRLKRSLTPWLSADLGAGIGIFERSSERSYWDIGVTDKWRRLSCDIRYFGDMKTDLPLCQFVDWCDAAVVGKLTLASY